MARDFKSLQKTYLKFLLKLFAENEKGKLSYNNSSFLSNLKNAKTKRILSPENLN